MNANSSGELPLPPGELAAAPPSEDVCASIEELNHCLCELYFMALKETCAGRTIGAAIADTRLKMLVALLSLT